MRVAERVTDVADRMQTRRLESKRETLDRDNDRLRTELRTIKQELDRERSARDELLHALKAGEGTVKADKVKVKTKKRGGLLRMLIIGGGAYVLGTRAGRERYDQIKGWASDMKDRVRSSDGGGDEWSSTSYGGSSGMSAGSTSGMSGSTGSTTGSGSTGTGSAIGSSGSTGSTGGTSSTSGSTSGSTGTTAGSTSSGSTGSGSTGTGSTGSGSSGSTGSTGSTGGSSKRSGSGSTS